jgi:hypothetical protein
MHVTSLASTCRRKLPKRRTWSSTTMGRSTLLSAVDRILAHMRKRRRIAAGGLVAFKTKAETLDALAPLLRNARVLPQVRFSVGDWHSDAAGVLAAVAAAPWGSDRVIVRSSARGEDGARGDPRLGSTIPYSVSRQRSSGTGNRPGD